MQTQHTTNEISRLLTHRPRRGAMIRLALLALFALPGLLLGGCATQGDLLSLREEVNTLKRSGKGSADPFARIAQLSSEVDSMREEIRRLQGELDLARKESADALAQIQRTRTSLAQQTAVAVASEVEAADAAEAAAASAAAAAAPPPDQELAGYQEALGAWRSGDHDVCIERFTGFLQNYPTSSYADDAAYWLADCTYKNEEYKRAVIRFSDVVRVYPDSIKAPDALYRQGESLLKLGPRFKDAARTVFKRVQADYPESERAAEARKQLERLGPPS